MNAELEVIARPIIDAHCPEDVFGVIDESDIENRLRALTKAYFAMVKKTHPDKYMDQLDSYELAQNAFGKLAELKTEAEEKIKNGTYGDRRSTQNGRGQTDFVVTTKKAEYHLSETLAQGDLSTVYSGWYDDAGVKRDIAVKVINDPADNDFMLREIRVLELLRATPGPETQHLPEVLDKFKIKQDGKFQQALILGYLNGQDLQAIREQQKYLRGMHQQDVGWICQRALSVLGHVHQKHVVHGNLEPAHMLIHPPTHNLFVLDWSYAAVNPRQTHDRFWVLNETYSAPEVAQRLSPLPSSDIYSLGKILIFLLGGDPNLNTIPRTVHPLFQRFIRALVNESAISRPRYALELHQEFKELRKRMWGTQPFRGYLLNAE